MLAVLAVMIFVVMVAVVAKRSLESRKVNMALLAEMTVLREENARLQEEIDELRDAQEASSAAIKNDQGIIRSTHS